ncbi:MAG: hypothetical protein HY689_11840 [Chloroflexi bacterium]|nr:hypothetical protein [Chloroflexota bacterium]
MTLANVRDVALIVLAVLAILQLLVLLVMTLLVYRKVAPLIDKIGPVLDSARTTATTVAGTSQFVGETVVAPIIRVASIAAGVRRGVATLGRLLGRKGAKA